MSVPIRVGGVHKSYHDGSRQVEVLRDLDLEVEVGELVCIVGPSGSGKSTLLHLLGALDRPDRGKIQIADLDLATLDPDGQARFRRHYLGFVFQFHELLPDFSALENVTMPARIAGWSAARAEQRGRQLLGEAGLADKEDRFPNQLSGGERQRVALVRALCLEPPLLLADEPTGNLDPEGGQRMFDLLLELRQRHGTTCLVVTHNPDIAARCERVLTLDQGRLQKWNPTRA